MTTSRTLFATSYPYFSSKHTPVFQGTSDDLKHKRKHQKFDVFSQYYNLFVNLRVYDRGGRPRLECLCLPLHYEMKSCCETVLDSVSNFEGVASFLFGAPIRVGGWNHGACKIECFVESDGHVPDSEWMEVNADKAECIVYLSDSFHDVARVCIYCLEPCMHERDAPHESAMAEIHNLCGYCRLPYNILFDAFHCLSPHKKQRGIASSDYVLNTNGNFVLCGRKNQIDFRGVRSISLMGEELMDVCGMELQEMTVYAYMIVLKGSIGKAPILCARRSYLESRISKWGECIFHAEEVCDVLEITNIQWAQLKLLFPRVSFSSCIVESSKNVNIFVSRKGGTIIRVTFHKNEEWNILKEFDILSDSNLFLNILHHVMLGKT